MGRWAGVVAFLSLVVATVALAAQPVHFTAADQAAAKAVVIRMSDLGATGWKGGFKKASLTPSPTCANYHPKQSDLVLTGIAESEYSKSGVDFDSEVQVLQTAQMVRLDWQRSVQSPNILTCLRSVIAKSLPATSKIVSFAQLSFPHLATYSVAYRLVLDFKSGATTVRELTDYVLVGRSRTEINLTTSAPDAARGPVAAAEVRLAKVLLGRITA